MRPLLLTGPPAAGKSATAEQVARSRPRCAVIDVDDIRHLVVSGHAAPWQGAEGALQQRLGVENACALAGRLLGAGIDVVLADVVDAATATIYRQQLPDLMIVRLRVPITEAQVRATLRPAYLTDREFDELYEREAASHFQTDAVVDAGPLSLAEQTAAVIQAWSEDRVM